MANQDYWIFDENPDTNDKYGCRPNNRTISELLDSGIVLINKPAGPTSHQLTAWARNLLGLNRLGHGGTLDWAKQPFYMFQASALMARGSVISCCSCMELLKPSPEEAFKISKTQV